MIRGRTDPRWVKTALEHIDALLVDHAHCEKKAAATALSLVASYPQHDRLVRRLSSLAIEELRHFRGVYRIIRRRGGELTPDRGDPYVQQLLKHMRHGPAQRLVDRLLVSGVIEARSHERLGLLANAFDDPGLAAFYADLAAAEAGHAELFVDLAHSVGSNEDVDARRDAWTCAEAEILAGLPIEPRIH